MTSDITIISTFIALLLACLFTSKIFFEQVQTSFIYYSSTVICAILTIGVAPDWSVHALYALLALPFIFISTLYGAAAIGIYAIFNIIISVDYIIYPDIVTIVAIKFPSYQLGFAFLLVISSVFKGKKDDYRIADSVLDWLGSRKNVFGSLAKMEKNQ